MESEAESSSGSKDGKQVVIDEEDLLTPEEDREEEQITGKQPPTTASVDIQNACPNCEVFRANADQAWDVLREFASTKERVKLLENANHQLNSLYEESKNYIEILRKEAEKLREVEREKDNAIRERDEKIMNLQAQYDMVLKAGHEGKKYWDELKLLKKDYAKKVEEVQRLEEELEYSLKRESSLNSKLKKALERLAAINKKEELRQRESLNPMFTTPKVPESEASTHVVNIQENGTLKNTENWNGTTELHVIDFDGPREIASSFMDDGVREQEESKRIEQEEHIEQEEQVEEATAPTVEANEKEDELIQELPEEEDEDELILELPPSPEPLTTMAAEEEDEQPSRMDNANEDLSERREEAPPSQTPMAVEKLAEPIPNSIPADEKDEQQSPMENGKTTDLNGRREKTPLREKTPPPQPSIEFIFNCRFLAEMRKMPFLENINFPVFLPKPKEPSKAKVNRQEREEVQKEEVQQKKPEIVIEGKFSAAPKLAIHEISKKYKVGKNEAASLYAHMKSEEAKKKRSSAGTKRRASFSGDEDADDTASLSGASTSRGETPKNMMPWIPHYPVIPKGTRCSVLSLADHKRYVAILQNRLKATPTYRFEQNKMELTGMDNKLKEERQFYEKTALQVVKLKQWKAAFGCTNLAMEAFKDHWRAKVELYFLQHTFRGTVLKIPWELVDDPADEKQDSTAGEQQQVVPLNFRIAKVLSEGEAKRVSIPDIRQKIIFDAHHVGDALQKLLKDKVPITEDPHIQDFALENDISFVMDASALRHFLSAAWIRRLHSCACRLTVVERVFRGTMRNLFIISAPVVASQVHKIAISHLFAKWSMKASLLYGKEAKAEGKARAKKNKKPKVETDDSCQSFLEELGLGNVGEAVGKGLPKRYAIVNFNDPRQPEGMERKHNNNVLIRTSVHGIEQGQGGISRPISLTARAEFLPEVAAEKMSIEERLWNIVTGVLKGSEEHLNFRVKVQTFVTRGRKMEPNYVLQYDRRQSKDFSKLDIETRKLLISRIQRFCALLDELSGLEVGEYMIVPSDDGQTLKVVKEMRADEEDEDGAEEGGIMQRFDSRKPKRGENTVYDSTWFGRLMQAQPVLSKNEVQDYWEGIDPHYPLQWHVVKSQIPGALRSDYQRGKGDY